MNFGDYNKWLVKFFYAKKTLKNWRHWNVYSSNDFLFMQFKIY